MATRIVTGVAELDAKLAALPTKLANKLTRQALRKGSKRLENKIKDNLPVNKGVQVKSTSVRSLKRSRTRVGTTTFVGAKKFFARYEKAYGHPPHPMKGEERPFFVPAAEEYGTPTQAPTMPVRRAMNAVKQSVAGDFRSDVTELINEAGR